MFGNAYYGETHDFIFGSKGTVMHDESDRVVYTPQGQDSGARPEKETGSTEKSRYLDSTGQHMQNFFDCVRSRKEPICPFETGFRSAIACQMAIASYRRQRTVRWDAEAQDIV